MNRRGSRRFARLCAVLAVLFLAWPAARAQNALPGARIPGPVFDAARQAFEAMPETERAALQDDLIWTGRYSGMADGTFGRQTFEALAGFQQSLGKAPTGILPPQDRAALAAVAQQVRAATGFAKVDDPRTGVRIGVPLTILPKRGENPTGGSRWQTVDGKITLDTRTAPPDATLPSLYERNLAIKSSGRAITYKLLRPDFFVIAGETAGGKFYTRYAQGAPGIRAFSIGYDKALAPQVDRVVVAIASTFDPFPATAAPAPAPTPSASTAPAAPDTPAPPLGTGLVVGARQVLTTAPVGGCKALRVGGREPRGIEGKGPFLLTFAQDLGVPPAMLTDAPVEPGTPLLVLAYGTADRLDVTAGEAGDPGALRAPLQPGAGGGPVLAVGQGVIGLAGPVPAEGRKVAGLLPSARYGFVSGADLRAAFPAAIPAEADRRMTLSPIGALVAALRPSVVAITCGK